MVFELHIPNDNVIDDWDGLISLVHLIDAYLKTTAVKIKSVGFGDTIYAFGSLPDDYDLKGFEKNFKKFIESLGIKNYTYNCGL